MDLRELNSGAGAPSTKPWLRPVCFSIEAKQVTADAVTAGQVDATGISADLFSLRDIVSVPNPPIGEVSFFSNGADFKATDPLGTTVTFLTSGGPASTGVTSNGAPSVAGNLPEYTDASGLIVTDSGVAAAAVPELERQAVATADQASVLAPRGQRDLWQRPTVGATGGGSSAAYSSALNIVALGANVIGANSIAWSADGGATFAAPVFDILPTTLFVIGSIGSKMTAVSVLPANLESYVSSDGQNWFQNPALAADATGALNVDEFAAAGLAITGCNLDAAHGVQTSPDGVVWTPQLSPTFAITTASNSSLAVSVSQLAPFAQSSPDGITWTGTPSPITACRAVCWSEERKEWLALGYNDGIGYRSTDGVNWFSLGFIAPQFVNAVMWVGAYERYYLTRLNPTTLNYSLWSTSDPTVAFVGTSLDGSVNSDPAYSILYLPIYDRFAMGVNSAPYFAYGTARQDVKALTDNIRVRGYPVRTANYSSYSDVAVTNTVVETTISNPASAVGSLTLQANQPLGARITLDLNLVASSVAGDSLTIRYYAGGILKFSHVLTIPALSVALPVNILSNIVLRLGSFQLNSFELVSTTPAMISAAAVVYNAAVAEAWSITAQWGANVNTMTMNSLAMSTDFVNGP